MSDEKRENEEYSFITETIKDKPINRKRAFVKIIMCIGAAILFGGLSSFTFVITKPYFEEKTKEEVPPDKITIPSDEMTDNMDEEVSKQEEQKPETVIVNNTVQLTVDDFKTLYRELANVAAKARKYMVTVTGVSSEIDWFSDTLENTNQASGVIFANNGQEILILSKRELLNDAQKIMVTFCDGEQYEGFIKAYDPNTDIAVIAVQNEGLSEHTNESYEQAVLGNSYATSMGDLTVAVGSPLGYADSATYGIITSSAKNVSAEDANYRIITTDAVGSSMASGVLVNTSGEVIAFIMPEYSTQENSYTVSALAISDLKTLIEQLSNNHELVQFGIKGSDVTAAIAKEHSLPVGIYIKDVIMDSPAMISGIQSGDVLVKLGEHEIKTFKDFQNALLEYKNGDAVDAVVMRQGKDEYKEVVFSVTLKKR